MKRVLVIAYLFPPILNSGTQRPLKFVKYLRHSGWEPIVLTADRLDGWPLDRRLLDEVPEGVRVLRVPTLDDRIGRLAGLLGVVPAARERIANGISWRLRQRHVSPDVFSSWQPTATRAAVSAFHRIGFDAIFATGYPWTSLLVGRDVSRSTGRPLVADFRDPWASEDLFGGPMQAGALELERTVIRQASAVTGISETMRNQLADVHSSEPATKFHALTNGFDAADLHVDAAPRSSRFRIVYTGVWKTGYGLDLLYDAIAQLLEQSPELRDAVEVVTAGFTPGPAAARGLASVVAELGVVPHQHAVSLMRSADALYLPNAEGDRQSWCIPGKLFEYLACERPVLATTKLGGEAAGLISRIGGGIVIDPGDRRRLIATLRDACVTGRLNAPPVDPIELSRYERRAITRRLATLLDAVQAA